VDDARRTRREVESFEVIASDWNVWRRRSETLVNRATRPTSRPEIFSELEDLEVIDRGQMLCFKIFSQKNLAKKLSCLTQN
jgi:hypothetical protein